VFTQGDGLPPSSDYGEASGGLALGCYQAAPHGAPEATWRLRFGYGLGSWARDNSENVRPIWLWLCRKLPNNTGRTVQLGSGVLPVRDKEQAKPWHNNPRNVENSGAGKSGILDTEGILIKARLAPEFFTFPG